MTEEIGAASGTSEEVTMILIKKERKKQTNKQTKTKNKKQTNKQFIQGCLAEPLPGTGGESLQVSLLYDVILLEYTRFL